MSRIKDFFKNRKLLELKFWQSALFLVVMSLGLTLFMLWLQPDGLIDVIKCIVKNRGLSLVLNWLPVLLAMFFLYFIGMNAIAAAALTGFIGIVMGAVNRFKILLRNDPFLPWDLSLGGEVAGIAKSFGARTILLFAVLILIYILGAIAISLLIRSEKLGFKIRLSGVAACIVIAIVLNKPLYKNVELNNNLYVIGNVYNQVNTFNSKGFLYSFIYSYNTNKIAKPDDYYLEAVLEEIGAGNMSGIESAQAAQKPHIIMVMGEAFSEMSLNPHFDFTGFTDPLENFKKIKEESFYGEIVVPNLGGGTADTEFDVLTGLSTRHLRGAPFAFRLIGGEFDSIAHSLNIIGYRSEFLHPGHAWFYNRQNVYQHMGFDQLVFMDAFEGVETKGMYINETATIDRIIDMFESSLETYPEEAYFHYCVTIQNHGPYKDKYLVETNFNTDLDISEDDVNAISNYYEGLIDADRELKRLTDYLEASGEPVVLIYYGDHLPAFTSRVYDAYYPNVYEEGSVEDLTRLYKTPFIIWENAAAKNLIQFRQENSESHMVISSNYLGAFLLQYLGYENISPFMDYVNGLREEYPIITEYKSFRPDGTSSTDADEASRKRLTLYRDWEFYKIFDEN